MIIHRHQCNVGASAMNDEGVVPLAALLRHEKLLTPFAASLLSLLYYHGCPFFLLLLSSVARLNFTDIHEIHPISPINRQWKPCVSLLALLRIFIGSGCDLLFDMAGAPSMDRPRGECTNLRHRRAIHGHDEDYMRNNNLNSMCYTNSNNSA